MVTVPLSRPTRRHLQGVAASLAGFGAAWALTHSIGGAFCALGVGLSLLTYLGELKIEALGVPNQFGVRLGAMVAAWALWLLMGTARSQVSPLVVALVGYFAGRLPLRFYVEGRDPGAQLPPSS